MTVCKHFERNVIERMNDFGEIRWQLRQQCGFEQRIELIEMALFRFRWRFQHLEATQNPFEFLVILMQLVNAQLKLVKTIFHVVVNAIVFPEFWHNLMAQQVANVQHNGFAYLI